MQTTDGDVETLISAAEAEWFELYKEGPSRLRWQELPLQVGDAAPDAQLLDVTGTVRSLAEFWSERPTIVMFWRHFGCNCGIERADRLREEYGAYRDAGAEVVVVTQGDPARAARYAERYGIECPVLCDPDRETYEAFGLLDFGPAQVLQGAPDEFLEFDADAGAAFAAERRDGGQPLVDSPWQGTGEFLVDSDGQIRLGHHYQYCEDYPDPDVFLTALRMID